MGENRLGESGSTGMTLTLYLERSYSTESRNANRFSAPLQRQAARRERAQRQEHGHTSTQQKEEKKASRQEKSGYVRTAPRVILSHSSWRYGR